MISLSFYLEKESFSYCLSRFYGRVNQTLTAIKDDISKLRPQSPMQLLNNIVAPLQKMSDNFRQQPQFPPRNNNNNNNNNVLESGPKDYLAEQHFSEEQFAVDPLPPPSDMNTMYLFNMAAAANPNHAAAPAIRRPPPSPPRSGPAAKSAAGSSEFFANFNDFDSPRASAAVTNHHRRPSFSAAAATSPDALNEFIQDFHFDREFAFSRLGEEEEEGGQVTERHEKTTFGEFALPANFHELADMDPPEWIKDSGGW